MKSLDLRLYAWLAEPDERRFERAFSAYFAVAFPAVIRYLARFSPGDSVRLEDLAQEALLRFFHKVGRGRREASQTVASTLQRLGSFNLGAFHARQVQAWIKEVAAFADSSMGFRIDPDEAGSKAAIRALVERVPPLQRQGWHLLQAVRVELGWSVDDQAGAGSSIEASDSVLSLFVAQLVAESAARSARALNAEGRHPGVTPFCENVLVVNGNLPQLRVPTNSYLFQIARSVFLDDCKHLGRQKRGGSGHRHPEADGEGAADLQDHPLDTSEGDHAFQGSGDDPGPLQTLSVDPATEFENEEFFVKFCEFLRAPVDQAASNYQRAAATGGGSAERRRLESLTDKLSRTLAVLSAIGEGNTQEQVAEQLDISRNQVKYIIELVQQAYAKFLADANASEQAHVS